MKLQFERLTVGSEEGFTFKEIRSRAFTCPWHMHAEYELILSVQCPGYRMVGDSVSPVEPGDLVLLGPNLPHLWHYERTGRGRIPPAHFLIVQFEETFLGPGFWDIPATHPLRQLLRRAAVGLQFTGKTRDRVARLLTEMNTTRGLRRMTLFLDALERLASAPDCHAIASPGYTAQANPFSQDRMNRVFQFIREHLDEPIALRDVARQAALSDGAFSRFFRLHTGRAFPEFVNQLRVGRACHLLAEGDRKVSDIAFACGFANLTNFNRQFRRLKQVTPREFRRRLRRLPGAVP